MTWAVLWARASFNHPSEPFHHQKTKKPTALSFTRGLKKILLASLQNFTSILLRGGESDSLESLMLVLLYHLRLLLFNTTVFLMLYYPIYMQKAKELYNTESIWEATVTAVKKLYLLMLN